ncbi:MAG TPA: helix-turn-helix domain-containing protein, partial [Acidobacteriota bacterium]|nr:helix-turn-helix domain-containing protein [Acidobacteriota bacterium]
PIGSKKANHVDVRIIAATNKDLEQQTQKGKFREDLFFRLNVLHIHLPALRERREDIPLMIDHFSRKIAKEMKVAVRKFPADILRSFALCDWPGNIRQLANEVRRFYILGSKYRSEKIVGTLQPKPKETEDVGLEIAERKAILKALEICSGNKTKAASLVGISRRGMYYKLKKYNLPPSSK